MNISRGGWSLRPRRRSGAMQLAVVAALALAVGGTVPSVSSAGSDSAGDGVRYGRVIATGADRQPVTQAPPEPTQAVARSGRVARTGPGTAAQRPEHKPRRGDRSDSGKARGNGHGEARAPRQAVGAERRSVRSVRSVRATAPEADRVEPRSPEPDHRAVPAPVKERTQPSPRPEPVLVRAGSDRHREPSPSEAPSPAPAAPQAEEDPATVPGGSPSADTQPEPVVVEPGHVEPAYNRPQPEPVDARPTYPRQRPSSAPTVAASSPRPTVSWERPVASPQPTASSPGPAPSSPQPVVAAPKPTTAAPKPAPTAPPLSDGGRVLWDGDFEVGGIPHGANGPSCGTGSSDGPDSGSDQYESVEEMGNSACTNRVEFSTTHVRTPDSKRSLMITLGANQEREQPESKFSWSPDANGSVDQWYGFSMYYDGNWNLMGGLLGEVSGSDWHNPVAFRADAANGSMNFSGDMNMNNENGKSYERFSTPHLVLRRNTVLNRDGVYNDGLGLDKLDLGPIVTNQWMDVVCHIRWSTTGNNALRECWRDGQYMGAKTSMNAVGGRHVLRIGQYQASGIGHPRTVYFDNVRIGTSHGAVDPSRVSGD